MWESILPGTQSSSPRAKDVAKNLPLCPCILSSAQTSHPRERDADEHPTQQSSTSPRGKGARRALSGARASHLVLKHHALG